MTNKNWMC